MQTVIYLKNRSTIVTLKDIILYEAQTSKVPNLLYLRRISCRVYKVVLHSKKLKKLDDQSKIRFLIRYKASNLYYIQNPYTGVVEQAKIVIFNKNLRISLIPLIKLLTRGPNYLVPLIAKIVLPYKALDRLPQQDLVQLLEEHLR